MRSIAPLARCAALALAGTMFFAVGAAPAGADRLRERAEVDSFGNLVVWSRSGYKRIVVGGGDLARSAARPAAAPDVVGGGDPADELAEGQYSEGPLAQGESGDDAPREREALVGGVYCPSAFVKGRAYMYGLADGEMPVISSCTRFGD
jgi:hypothetical protein